MADTPPPVLSVVVPLYNEEKIVDELVDRLLASAARSGEPFEIVLVNDGSHDRTLDRLVARSLDDGRIRVIDLLRNFGHMHALSAGVEAARGEAVIVLDGDLQDPPELIPTFVLEWRKGFDVLYGLRTERKEGPLQQFLTGIFYTILHVLADTPIPRQVGTYSLMDRRVVDSLISLPERHRYFAGLRAWVGGRQGHIPYERQERAHGKSRVGSRGLFGLARTALVSFSKAPLRITAWLALMVAVLVFAAGVAGLILGTINGTAPTWAIIAVILGLIAGTQALAIGAIAEYVAVMMDEVKARPLFLVRNEYRRGVALGREQSAVVTPFVSRPKPSRRARLDQ